MHAQPLHAERRSYPRIPLFRSMSLEDEGGDSVKANLRDLCPGGLQAMCDNEGANALLPSGEMTPYGDAAKLTARFNLPVSNHYAAVEIECQMVHLSVVPEEGIALGLTFLSFHGDSLAILGRFILESLEPTTG